MNAVVFELLAERRKRNPRELSPDERAAYHVHKRLAGKADGDLIQIAQGIAPEMLACGQQMQRAIDDAVHTAMASMRLRHHYTGGDLPPAA